MLLHAMTFSQFCEMCATPCYVVLFDVGVNIEAVRS